MILYTPVKHHSIVKIEKIAILRLFEFFIAAESGAESKGALQGHLRSTAARFSSRSGRLRRDSARASLMPGRVGLRNTRATLTRVDGCYVCVRVRLPLP